MKILQKTKVNELLSKASEKWDVYAPIKHEGEDVNFAKLPKSCGNSASVVLSDVPTVISPKYLFFPQSEQMYEFAENKIIKENIEESPKLLFGINACDLKGLLFADEFFKKNFPDKYYLSRMEGRLTVVKGCNKPPRPNACFCTSAKTGPFVNEGFDIQIIDIGESFAVETGSKNGEAFLKEYAQFFTENQNLNQNEIDKIKKSASDAVALKIEFDKALDIMADEKSNFEEIFKKIGERCIYCGACLFSCPTCTCFNVFDRIKEGKGARLRNWDGCVFEGYTREASGHNPRQLKAKRTGRRYEHKLKYDFSSTGKSGCVGCGRCLFSCPVAIGMSKFIQEITEKIEVM